MSKLEKSAETRRKEEEIKKLRLAIKKKRTTVKRLRTRLENTKTNIVDMQRNVNGTILSVNKRIATIREEMIGLLKKLRGRPFLDERQGEVVERLLDEMSEVTPDLDEAFTAQMKEHFEQYDDDDGVITLIRCGKRSLLCPLYLLDAKKDAWWTQALDDYRAWAQYRLPAL